MTREATTRVACYARRGAVLWSYATGEHPIFARQNAHNRRGPAINADGLSDDLRIGAEATLPEAVCQQDGRGLDLVHTLLEETNAPTSVSRQHRSHAQQRKELARDAKSPQPFRHCAIIGKIEVPKKPIGKLSERTCLLLPVEGIGC